MLKIVSIDMHVKAKLNEVAKKSTQDAISKLRIKVSFTPLAKLFWTS